MWGPVGLVAPWVGAPELRETTICSGIFWTCFHSSDIRQYGSHLASECRRPCYLFLTLGGQLCILCTGDLILAPKC